MCADARGVYLSSSKASFSERKGKRRLPPLVVTSHKCLVNGQMQMLPAAAVRSMPWVHIATSGREQQLRLRKAVLEIVILRWSSTFLCAVDDCFRLDLVLPRLQRIPALESTLRKRQGKCGLRDVKSRKIFWPAGAAPPGRRGQRLKAGAARISRFHPIG